MAAQIYPTPATTTIKVPGGGTDRQNLAALLDKLFSSPTLKEYGCYFFMQVTNYDDEFLAVVGKAMQYSISKPNQNYTWRRFDESGEPPHAAVLNVQFMTQLSSTVQSPCPPFQGANNVHQVFVYLDKHQCWVPFQTASLLSTLFVSGLAARLLLDAYNTKWQTINPPKPAALNLSFSPPAQGKPYSIDTWTDETIKLIATTLTTQKNWNNWATAPKPYQSTDFKQCLNFMTDASMQVAAIMMGWRAGDSVVAAGGADTKNIMQLLRSIYTVYHLGEIIGYIFPYLSGFLKNERTAIVAKGVDPKTNPDPGQLVAPTHVSDIYNNLQQHNGAARDYKKNKDAVFSIQSDFCELIVGEFYMINVKPINANYTIAMQQQALTYYGDFLNGIFQGMSNGVDVMLSEVFQQAFIGGYDDGYVTGYANGFRDGYSQGYASGYQAGYANGYSAGYADGQDSWSQLTNIVQSVGGGLQSLGSVLGDLGTVGSVVTDLLAL
jgi:hypothetical protein